MNRNLFIGAALSTVFLCLAAFSFFWLPILLNNSFVGYLSLSFLLISSPGLKCGVWCFGKSWKKKGL